MSQPTRETRLEDLTHVLDQDRHPAAVAVVSADGRVAFWNRAAERLFGYPRQDALGRNLDALILPPHLLDERHEAMRQAAATGSACYLTERRRRDGSALAVCVTLDVPEGSGDDPAHTVVTIRPVDRMRCLCGAAAAPLARSAVQRLTARQREVLRLIALGRSTRDIAGALRLSPKTIETHRAHLLKRLEVNNVAGLVRRAMEAGLLPRDA